MRQPLSGCPSREMAAQEAPSQLYGLDPTLARRYGLIPKAADVKLAAPPAAAVLSAIQPNSGVQPAVPTVAGLRSLRIEIRTTGRPYQFTRVLNLSGEPFKVRVSVMSTRAFVVMRTVLQLIASGFGLVLVGWQCAVP